MSLTELFLAILKIMDTISSCTLHKISRHQQMIDSSDIVTALKRYAQAISDINMCEASASRASTCHTHVLNY